MAERYRNIGHNLARQFADPRLMRAVDIGVDQADGNRLDALRFQLRQCGANIVLVKRTDFRARRVHPAFYSYGIFERRQRRWFWPDDPRRQSAGHIRPRNLHDVAVALGHDQANACSLALQHRIGRHGCTVQEIFDGFGINFGLRTNRGDAGQYAFRTIMRSGRRFMPPECSSALVKQQEIGKRPPDINAQTVPHIHSSLYAATGNLGALATIPGSLRSIIPDSHWLAAIMRSKSIPVDMPARSSM